MCDVFRCLFETTALYENDCPSERCHSTLVNKDKYYRTSISYHIPNFSIFILQMVTYFAVNNLCSDIKVIFQSENIINNMKNCICSQFAVIIFRFVKNPHTRQNPNYQMGQWTTKTKTVRETEKKAHKNVHTVWIELNNW